MERVAVSPAADSVVVAPPPGEAMGSTGWQAVVNKANNITSSKLNENLRTNISNSLITSSSKKAQNNKQECTTNRTLFRVAFSSYDKSTASEAQSSEV
jgi:hypothetical protein